MRGDAQSIKKFVLRLIGSPDIYNEREIDPQKSINFITCHDGFNLNDLVSYSYKHNIDNGEHGRTVMTLTTPLTMALRAMPMMQIF